jgi:hypothetical protein
MANAPPPNQAGIHSGRSVSILRDQRHLGGEHHRPQGEHKQQVASPELKAGKGIPGQRGRQDHAQGAQGDDKHGVDGPLQKGDLFKDTGIVTPLRDLGKDPGRKEQQLSGALERRHSRPEKGKEKGERRDGQERVIDRVADDDARRCTRLWALCLVG